MQGTTGMKRSVFLLVGGVFVSLMCILGPAILGDIHRVSFSDFVLFAFLFGLAGFVPRVVRRKVFFGSANTWHQAFSFETIFQSAPLVYPTDSFEDFETAFIHRETGIDDCRTSAWQFLRYTIRVLSPLVMLAVLGLLVASPAFSVVATLVVAGGLLYQLRVFGLRFDYSIRRYLTGVFLGCLAYIAEGMVLASALQAYIPQVPLWQGFSLFMLLSIAMRSSIVPFGFGVLELAFLAFAALASMNIGVETVHAYRIVVSAPLLLAGLFYLPRYKLSIFDLDHPSLVSQMRRVWMPGHRPSVGADGVTLSIVIPAYNECERLPVFLPLALEYCAQLPYGSEIIVSDDGSTDATVEYVSVLQKSYPALRLLKSTMNMGKGAAVKRGVLASRGAYILFADADGATPIQEVDRLVEALKQGWEIAIASRRLSTSNVDRTRYRGLLGSLFYRITNLLAVPGVADTQCGFKLFTRNSAQRLFEMIEESGWAFDVELLFLAQKYGMSVTEVPVSWKAVDGSKVHPVYDALRMLVSLSRIRRRWAGIPVESGVNYSMITHCLWDGQLTSLGGESAESDPLRSLLGSRIANVQVLSDSDAQKDMHKHIHGSGAVRELEPQLRK